VDNIPRSPASHENTTLISQQGWKKTWVFKENNLGFRFLKVFLRPFGFLKVFLKFYVVLLKRFYMYPTYGADNIRNPTAALTTHTLIK